MLFYFKGRGLVRLNDLINESTKHKKYANKSFNKHRLDNPHDNWDRNWNHCGHRYRRLSGVGLSVKTMAVLIKDILIALLRIEQSMMFLK